MADRFSSFVVFAEMRTGSNFLETNLNALPGVRCHGEAFNPHFIGYPNREELLGVTEAEREADPSRVLDAIRSEPNVLGGFRYFHDHDPRVFDQLVEDASVAKIILTRNPLDSYVSWKIAVATGQWKLTNVTRRKEAKAEFDAEEFAIHVDALQEFQITLLNRLQRSGQTAFYIAYEDLQDVEVMNGLAKWLGVEGRLEVLDDSLKRQNPAPVVSKVENPDDMAFALAGMDRFNLARTPNFEPRRGPAVPGYVAGVVTPILYMPVRGGLTEGLSDWVGALDNVDRDGVITGMNQKQLRQWRRNNPGHRSFTVVRHPLARAHWAFSTLILSKGPGSLRQIRNTLRRRYKVEIPEGAPGSEYSAADHRKAFAQFLDFLKANLAGQTSIRVDGNWASQAQILAGFAELSPPDLVVREEDMARDLPELARRLGRMSPPMVPRAPRCTPYSLEDIWDRELEAQCQSVYARDYMSLGYDDWKPSSL